MKDIVYFDLETKKSFGDVGGAANKDKMGISIGVAYSTRTGDYHLYQEHDSEALIQLLLKADLVVGYNHLYFDYPVLQGHTILDLASQTVNLDMMLDIEQRVGRRLKLEYVAAGSLGTGKSAAGIDALKWWQEYKKTGEIEPMMKIVEYCAYDVKVTKCVHEYGVQHGHIKFDDGSGRVEEVEVDWS